MSRWGIAPNDLSVNLPIGRQSCLFIGDHALDSHFVGLVSVCAATEASLALGVFTVTVEQVALVGLATLHLAGLGQAEPLFGTAVGFELNLSHNGLTSFPLLFRFLGGLRRQKHVHVAAF